MYRLGTVEMLRTSGAPVKAAGWQLDWHDGLGQSMPQTGISLPLMAKRRCGVLSVSATGRKEIVCVGMCMPSVGKWWLGLGLNNNIWLWVRDVST